MADIQMPSQLNWLYLSLSGEPFPEGSETGMGQVGQQWADSTAHLQEALAQIGPAAATIGASLSGESATQFHALMAQLHEQAPGLAEGGAQVGLMASNTAPQLQYGKMMLILQTYTTLSQLLWAAYNAVATFGASEVMVPALIALARLNVKMILRRLLMAMGMGFLFGEGFDLAVQTIQAIEAKHDGRHFSWNLANSLESSFGGVVGGALGGEFHEVLNLGQERGIGDKLFGHVIGSELANLGTTVLSDLTFGGDDDPLTGLASGLAGSLAAGHAVHASPEIGDIHVGVVNEHLHLNLPGGLAEHPEGTGVGGPIETVGPSMPGQMPGSSDPVLPTSGDHGGLAGLEQSPSEQHISVGGVHGHEFVASPAEGHVTAATRPGDVVEQNAGAPVAPGIGALEPQPGETPGSQHEDANGQDVPREALASRSVAAPATPGGVRGAAETGVAADSRAGAPPVDAASRPVTETSAPTTVAEHSSATGTEHQDGSPEEPGRQAVTQDGRPAEVPTDGVVPVGGKPSGNPLEVTAPREANSVPSSREGGAENLAATERDYQPRPELRDDPSDTGGARENLRMATESAPPGMDRVGEHSPVEGEAVQKWARGRVSEPEPVNGRTGGALHGWETDLASARQRWTAQFHSREARRSGKQLEQEDEVARAVRIVAAHERHLSEAVAVAAREHITSILRDGNGGRDTRAEVESRARGAMREIQRVFGSWWLVNGVDYSRPHEWSGLVDSVSRLMNKSGLRAPTVDEIRAALVDLDSESVDGLGEELEKHAGYVMDHIVYADWESGRDSLAGHLPIESTHVTESAPPLDSRPAEPTGATSDVSAEHAGEDSYESAAELLNDLRSHELNQRTSEPHLRLLGPDLFGLYDAPPAPPFLRGHDYRQLTPRQTFAFLDKLDLAGSPKPSPKRMAPEGIKEAAEGWVLERTRADRELSRWAPGDVPPLEKTTSTPRLIHGIWLGGPLRDAGKMSLFRRNFGESGKEFAGKAVTVLWTDVPREDFVAASREGRIAVDGHDPLADVRDMSRWASENNVLLVNVNEVFNHENPMVLQEFYSSEVNKRTGPGYAAASDILRMQLMHDFGGMFADGDNKIEKLDDLTAVSESVEGFAVHRIGVNVGNDAFVMSKGHPFAAAYLDQLRENYERTQEELLPPELKTSPPEEFDTPLTRPYRHTVMVRSGPQVLAQVARRLGYDDYLDLPGMEHVSMHSAGSWLSPLPKGESALPPHDRESTLALTKSVIQTLVRGLRNRDGDLHLTAVEPVVLRHPNPDLVWHAVLAHIAGHPELSREVRTVTDRQLINGESHDVRLPNSLRSMMTTVEGGERHMLGEIRRLVTLHPDSRHNGDDNGVVGEPPHSRAEETGPATEAAVDDIRDNAKSATAAHSEDSDPGTPYEVTLMPAELAEAVEHARQWLDSVGDWVREAVSSTWARTGVEYRRGMSAIADHIELVLTTLNRWVRPVRELPEADVHRFDPDKPLPETPDDDEVSDNLGQWFDDSGADSDESDFTVTNVPDEQIKLAPQPHRVEVVSPDDSLPGVLPGKGEFHPGASVLVAGVEHDRETLISEINKELERIDPLFPRLTRDKLDMHVDRYVPDANRPLPTRKLGEKIAGQMIGDVRDPRGGAAWGDEKEALGVLVEGVPGARSGQVLAASGRVKITVDYSAWGPIFEVINETPMATLPGEGRYAETRGIENHTEWAWVRIHSPENQGKLLTEVFPTHEGYQHYRPNARIGLNLWGNVQRRAVHQTHGLPLASVRHVIASIVDRRADHDRFPSAGIQHQHLVAALGFGDAIAAGFARIRTLGEPVTNADLAALDGYGADSPQDDLRNFATLVYAHAGPAISAAVAGTLAKHFSHLASRTGLREVFGILPPAVRGYVRHNARSAQRLVADLYFAAEGELPQQDRLIQPGSGLDRDGVLALPMMRPIDDDPMPTVKDYLNDAFGVRPIDDAQYFFGVSTRVPLDTHGRGGVPLIVTETRDLWASAPMERVLRDHFSASIREADGQVRRSRHPAAPLDSGFGPLRDGATARDDFDRHPAAGQVDVERFGDNRSWEWTVLHQDAARRIEALPDRDQLLATARTIIARYGVVGHEHAEHVRTAVAARLFTDEALVDPLWGPHELARDLVTELGTLAQDAPRNRYPGLWWTRDGWGAAVAQAHTFVSGPQFADLRRRAQGLVQRYHSSGSIPRAALDGHERGYLRRFDDMVYVAAHQLSADSGRPDGEQEARVTELIKSFRRLPGARRPGIRTIGGALRDRQADRTETTGSNGSSMPASGSRQPTVVPSGRDAGADLVGEARVNRWTAVEVTAVDVEKVREAARGLLGRNQPLETITEKALTEGFENALHSPEGQVIDLVGRKVTLRVVGISRVSGDARDTGTVTEATTKHEYESGAWDAQDSAERAQSDLSSVLKAPTPYVTVSGKVHGNTAGSSLTTRHARTTSTEIAQHVTTASDGYRVTYAIGTSHGRTVEATLDMRLSSPNHDSSGAQKDLRLAYPSRKATANTRTRQYRDIQDAVNSIEHAELDTTELARAITKTFGRFKNDNEHTRFTTWLGGLGEREQAQRLFGEGTVRETFTFEGLGGDKEILVKLKPRGQSDGKTSPKLMARFLDRGSVTITHTHNSTTSEAAARSATQGIGGDISVSSDALTQLIGPKVSVDLSLTHSAQRTSRDGEDYGVTQWDTYEGQADKRQLEFSYVVGTGNRDETVLVDGSAVLTMVEQAHSQTDGSRPDTPTVMNHTEIPDLVHARYELDDRTVEDIVGRTLTQLNNTLGRGAINLAQTKAHLVTFVHSNARDILDGNDGNAGDGLAFPLGKNNGAPYLFLRGHVLRDDGTYLGVDRSRRFGDTVTSSHSREIDRSTSDHVSLGVKVNAGVGPVDLTGKLTVSSDWSREDKLGHAQHADHSWSSTGELHRYRYPIEIEALVGNSLDDASPLRLPEHVDSGGPDNVTITVPGRAGQHFAEPSEPVAAESPWRVPDPASARRANEVPPRYDVESLKPITGLRTAAVRALTEALPAAGVRARDNVRATLKWVTTGDKVRSLTETQDGMPGGHAVGQWSSREARLAKIRLATSGAHDRLHLEGHNDGGLFGATGRDVFGELTLRTTLHRPRIVHLDPEHLFTDTQGRQTNQSFGEHRGRGVDASVEADLSQDLPHVPRTSVGLTAQAKAGLHHETDANADSRVEITTTSQYRTRGYLVAYDAEHELTASAHHSETGFFGGRHDEAAHNASLIKEQPDAARLWVEAGDLPVIALPREELAKLTPEDQGAYLSKHPEIGADPRLAELAAPPRGAQVDPPHNPQAGIGTFQLHRAGALDHLLGDVTTKLEEWHRGIEDKIEPMKAVELSRFSQQVVEELGESLVDSLGFGVEDALNGGLLFLRQSDSAESGRLEQLVVIDAQLDGGSYHDTIDDYNSTVTYSSTADRADKKGNILSGTVSADTGLAVELPKVPNPSDNYVGKQAGGVANSVVGYAGDKTIGRVTDQVHPALTATTSWDNRAHRQQHSSETVTIHESGKAFRFAYGLRARIRVYPWVRDGQVTQHLRHLIGDTGHRLTEPWESGWFTVPSAVRLTVREDHYLAQNQPVAALDGKSIEVTASLRSRRASGIGGAGHFCDDAIVHVYPFDATRLHGLVDKLAAGADTPQGQVPVLSAHRAHTLRSATATGELVRNFRQALDAEGYRIELDGPVLKGLRIELDLNRIVLVRKLEQMTLDGELTGSEHGGRQSEFKGNVEVDYRGDGTLIMKDGSAEHEHDAKQSQLNGHHSADEPLFLVHAQLLSSIEPEYAGKKAPEGWGLDPRNEPDGLVRLAVNGAGLRDLGFDLDKVTRWSEQQSQLPRRVSFPASISGPSRLLRMASAPPRGGAQPHLGPADRGGPSLSTPHDPQLRGRTLDGRPLTFLSSQVDSVQLVDRTGTLLGVGFPTKSDNPATGEEGDERFMVHTLRHRTWNHSQLWRVQHNPRHDPADPNSRPIRHTVSGNTPWHGQSRPIYVMAHGTGETFDVRVASESGARRVVKLDGATYARVLRSNQHYWRALRQQSASGDEPHSLVLVACSTRLGADTAVTDFADHLHSRGIRQTVYSPDSEIEIESAQSGEEVSLGLVDRVDGPGRFIRREPPSDRSAALPARSTNRTSPPSPGSRPSRSIGSDRRVSDRVLPGPSRVSSSHAGPVGRTPLPPRHDPELLGKDEDGAWVRFPASKVVSIPFVDRETGRPVGVSFPSVPEDVQEAHELNSRWNHGIRLRAEHNSDHDPTNPDSKEHYVSEFLDTPWKDGPRPAYVVAHADTEMIDVWVAEPGSRPKEVSLDGETFARMLLSNEHYHAALGSNRNRPLVLVACTEAPGASVSRLVEHLRREGSAQTVYASDSRVSLHIDDGETKIAVSDRYSRTAKEHVPGNYLAYGPQPIRLRTMGSDHEEVTGTGGRPGTLVIPGVIRADRGRHDPRQLPEQGPYYRYQVQGQDYYYPAVPTQDVPIAPPPPEPHPTTRERQWSDVILPEYKSPSPSERSVASSNPSSHMSYSDAESSGSSSSGSERSETAFPHRGPLRGIDQRKRPQLFHPTDINVHPVTSKPGGRGQVVALSFHTSTTTRDELEYNMQVQKFRNRVSVLKDDPSAAYDQQLVDWKRLGLLTNRMFVIDAHSPGGDQVVVRLNGSNRRLELDGRTFAATVIARQEFQDAVRVLGDENLSYLLLICETGAKRGEGGVAHAFAEAMRRNGYYGPVLAPTTEIWTSTVGDEWTLGLRAGGEIESFPEVGLGGTT